MPASVKQLFAAALFVLCAGSCLEASACSCVGGASPCGQYAAASAVVVGNVKRVEPAGTDSGYDGAQTAHVHVERAFKGEVGDEIVLRQPGHNCAPKFKAGDRWLMYVHFHKKTGAWEVYGCGRSGPVESSGDDLLYLMGLPESATRTRLSGQIARYENDPHEGFKRIGAVAGAKVKISGEGLTREIVTDVNGVYEAYDLPPGRYAVTPEFPAGLKLRFPMPFGDIAAGGDVLNFELKPKSCAGSDFLFSSDTIVSGRVLGADGEALPNVCLKLAPAEGKAAPYFRVSDCTDAEGRYTLDEIPPGRYVVVLNDDGRPSAHEPFPTAYYPGVFERQKATVVSVAEGDRHTDVDVRLQTLLPTWTLRGVMRYADGRPAAGAHVRFDGAGGPPASDADSSAKTDGQGRFAVKILRGASGRLSGSIYTSGMNVAECPELRKQMAARPGHMPSEVGTKPVMIAAEPQPDEQIVLTLPFPYCPEKKPD